MSTLIHYGEAHTRAFPHGVDIWLPEGAVVINAERSRAATTITYLVPTGRKSVIR